MLDTLPASSEDVGADRPTTRTTSLRRAVHITSRPTSIAGAADSRTTRHTGYGVSQTIRKRIEEHFGWGKAVGRIRRCTEGSVGSASTSS